MSTLPMLRIPAPPRSLASGALRLLFASVMAAALSGCSPEMEARLGLRGTWLASSGPLTATVKEQTSPPVIPVVAVTKAVADRITAAQHRDDFSETLIGPATAGNYRLGAGDMLTISVWEAPPAILFGVLASDIRQSGPTAVSSLPEQMISAEGTVNVPFVGNVIAAGRTPKQVEETIVARLQGKANQPQVIVRLTRNVTSSVTVVGEVAHSGSMPLSAKGEKLLDALAFAGGVQQAVGKMSIQLTRGGQVRTMPLDAIIRDPRQNVRLEPGDVVTALYLTSSFTVLGASNKNDEIRFEAQGITLAQALGRIGGLQGGSADPRGVFIFRYEDDSVLGENAATLPHTANGKVPVIYQADLKDPGVFLVSQDFPMQNKDVIYVATAPVAELQAFLNILATSIYTPLSLIQLTK